MECRRLLIGTALAWVALAPGVEAIGLAPGRAVRGWHMFHDVARHTCRWGLADAGGRAVDLGSLDRGDWDRFASFARANGAGDPTALCARGLRPTLDCPGEAGWANVPLEFEPCP